MVKILQQLTFIELSFYFTDQAMALINDTVLFSDMTKTKRGGGRGGRGGGRGGRGFGRAGGRGGVWGVLGKVASSNADLITWATGRGRGGGGWQGRGGGKKAEGKKACRFFLRGQCKFGKQGPNSIEKILV